MNILFGDNAFRSSSAAKNYATTMNVTHPKHMMPPELQQSGSIRGINALERQVSSTANTGAGDFRNMLKALDNVSDAQKFASKLQVEAIINPDSVDIHDVTMAQAQASLSLNITRNILNRLVQGWRDLINTR